MGRYNYLVKKGNNEKLLYYIIQVVKYSIKLGKHLIHIHKINFEIH